jgi:EAL domain-containing protein (putative c-di-GMP-specific phosphodiesterase class I)
MCPALLLTDHVPLSAISRHEQPFDRAARGRIANLGRDEASDTIVSGFIQLAHDLGMSIVGEGVESAEQQQHLATVGCDSCQGFSSRSR